MWKGCGLTVADKNRTQIVIKNHHEEAEILQLQLGQLDLVVRAGDRFGDSGKDPLEKRGEEGVQYIEDLGSETVDYLIEEPQE